MESDARRCSRHGLGNSTFLTSLGVETKSRNDDGERMRGDGATVINIAINRTD